MREKSKKIAREKKHKILKIFEIVANKVHKDLKTRDVTIDDLKKMWEMVQVELGLSTSRSELGLKQEPRTPEEKERGRQLDEAIKQIITGRQKDKHPLLDRKGRNKK